jgi:hypothetical protein
MKYWARLDLIKMKLKTFVTVILIAIVAGACSPSTPATPTQDVNAVYTQAALLVATQFSMLQTQTAMAVPPTAQATPTLPAIISTLPVFGTPGTPIVPFGFTPIATVIATLPSGGTGSTANGCNDSQFISETTQEPVHGMKAIHGHSYRMIPQPGSLDMTLFTRPGMRPPNQNTASRLYSN